MKKNILHLAIKAGALAGVLAGASPTYAAEACETYMETAVGSSDTSYDYENAAILITNQLLSATVDAMGFSSLSAVFPYASILVRQIKPGEDTTVAENLVSCLEEFDNRISALDTWVVNGETEGRLTTLRANIVDQVITGGDNSYHYDASEEYNSISDKIGSIISYWVDPDLTQSADIYNLLAYDSVPNMMAAKLLAVSHNLEYNAYCAGYKGVTWSDDAIDTLDNPSANFAFFDYDLQMDWPGTLEHYGNDVMYENLTDGSDCDLGRDNLLTYQSLVKDLTDHTISDALVDLGLTVTLNDIDSNYLDVSVDTDSSLLWDYRKTFINECQQSSSYNNYTYMRDIRSWSEDSYSGESYDVTFSLHDGNDVDAAKDSQLTLCETFHTEAVSSAKAEVLAILSGVKVTLEQINLYSIVRPATELAGRKTQFDTYITGIIEEDDYDTLDNYMLIPQFTVNDEDNIIGDYNHYQIYNPTTGLYLALSDDDWPIETGGSDDESSIWEISETWPGEGALIKNMQDNECLFRLDVSGKLITHPCSWGSLFTPWEVNTANAAEIEDALVYLHSAQHQNKCLAIGDETMPAYNDANVLVGEDCDEEDETQLAILDEGRILVNDLCLTIPDGDNSVDQTLIFQDCSTDTKQQWDLNSDGSIQTGQSTENCLEASDLVTDEDGNDIDISITLQTCDSTNPAQKFAPDVTIKNFYTWEFRDDGLLQMSRTDWAGDDNVWDHSGGTCFDYLGDNEFGLTACDDADHGFELTDGKLQFKRDTWGGDWNPWDLSGGACFDYQGSGEFGVISCDDAGGDWRINDFDQLRWATNPWGLDGGACFVYEGDGVFNFGDCTEN